MFFLEGVFTEDQIKVTETRKINIASNFVGFQSSKREAHIEKLQQKGDYKLTAGAGFRATLCSPKASEMLHWHGGSFKLLRCLNDMN